MEGVHLTTLLLLLRLIMVIKPMRVNLLRFFPLVLGLVIVATGTLVSYPVRAEPDMLERPALISKRSESSVMLAVTRAGKRLVAVGERGVVLFSDDNGIAWKQAAVPVSISLTNVFFITDKKGWVVGHSGIVLYSKDGGESWVKQLDGKQVGTLVLDAVKKKTGASGDDKAAQQRLDEANRLVADGPDKPFLDVYFSDENSGFIVGAYGLMFHTVDGGKSWIPWQEHVDNSKGKHLYRIRAAGGALFIAGEQGALFHSSDSGQRFSEIKTPYSGSYFGVVAEPAGNIVAYGLRGNAYWSGNMGKTWQKIAVGTPSLLAADTRLTDGSLLIVSHDGDVLRSIDEGHSFSPISVKQTSPYTGVTQAADGSIILSGMRGVTRVPYISVPANKS